MLTLGLSVAVLVLCIFFVHWLNGKASYPYKDGR